MPKLFVGNLPWDVKSTDLSDILRRDHGLAMEYAEVVTERDTGRSRGFGFIHFPTQADAEAAKEKLSGAVVGGRTIVVDDAREERGRGGGRPRGDGGRRPAGGDRGRRGERRGARGGRGDRWVWED